MNTYTETAPRGAKDIMNQATSDMKNVAKTAMTQASQLAEQKLSAVNENISAVQRNTEEYLKKNIWGTVGVSVGVGIFLGLVLSRR